jgi:Polyketide cyclase / dehydrase and lipid transport
VRNPNRYRFRSSWHLDASADRVYDVLVEVVTYPQWWPQVRAVRQLDDSSGELICRSMLPYDLTFVLHRDIEDRGARILRANMTGDLSGTSQWTIEAAGSGSVAVFDEDVEVRRTLLRTAGLLARPALSFNHGLMMRSGEKGLRAYLGAGA